MPSPQPQQSHAPREIARRRQRSTRLIVAVALLAAAAVIVAGAVASSSALLTTVAAVVAIVTGAAATRITHSELMATRREAARDRATQAQEYRVINDRRTAENAAFAADMVQKIVNREHAIDVLEQALFSAQKNAAEQTLKRGQEARRADGAERGRDDSNVRAAQAVVRVGELEAELGTLRSELDTLRAEAERRANRSA